MQKNNLIPRSKKACADPTHKTENILFKIAIGLVIAITFNTFTSAFLLFSVYSQTKAQIQPRILKDELGFRKGEVSPTAAKRVATTPASALSKAIETQIKNNLSTNISVEENVVELGKLIQSMNLVISGIQTIQNIQNVDWRRSNDVSTIERNLRATAESIQTIITACDRTDTSCPFDSSQYKETWRPHLEKLAELLLKLADMVKNALADQKITAQEISLIVETGKTMYNELASVRKDAQSIFTSKLTTLTQTIETRVSLQKASQILTDSKEEIASVIASEGSGHKAAELLEDIFTTYSASLEQAINAYLESAEYQNIASKISSIQSDLSALEKESLFTKWLPGIYTTSGNLLNLLSGQELASIMKNLNSTLANPVSNPNFYGMVAVLFVIDYGISPDQADEPWASLWGSLAGEALTISGSVQVLNAISEVKSCVVSNADSNSDQIIDKAEWQECVDSATCIPSMSGCIEIKLQELLKIIQTPINLGKIPQCFVDAIKKNVTGCLLAPTSCVTNILTDYQSCMSL